jgi:hypothetical protein
MPQTAQQYYSSENNYGSYQYTDLKTIIDGMVQAGFYGNNYIKHTRRSQFVKEARAGIRELNREVKRTIAAMEITVGPKLYVPVPEDFVDWVRVSIILPNFRLKKIKENVNIPTALGYLQDSDYNILFDSDGEVLLADSSNHFNRPQEKFTIAQWDNDNKYGEFVFDEARGVFGFSTDLEDKEVIIEYVSDGLAKGDLKEEEIKVHKYLEDALVAYIYYNCIRWRRSTDVPYNEKIRAKNEYKALKHRAKLDRLQFNIADMNTPIEFKQNSTRDA